MKPLVNKQALHKGSFQLPISYILQNCLCWVSEPDVKMSQDKNAGDTFLPRTLRITL